MLPEMTFITEAFELIKLHQHVPTTVQNDMQGAGATICTGSLDCQGKQLQPGITQAVPSNTKDINEGSFQARAL